jgi:hypothetical protein
MTQQVLPEYVEKAWKHYTDLVPLNREPSEPLKCYVFQRRDDWEAFTRRFTGPRAGKYLRISNGGYSERGVSVAHYIRRDSTLAVLSHEGFHAYLDVNFPKPVPAWLNEGLATWCEGTEWQGQHVRFAPRQNSLRVGGLRDAARRSELMPLAELLRNNAGHYVGTGQLRSQVYYSQLWALMWFLEDGEDGRYRDAFARMRRELAEGKLMTRARAMMAASPGLRLSFGEAVFRSCITEDVDRFEAEFLAFILKMRAM